ncbi:MAG TPA: hypothetical protein VFZ36_05105 [Vicinamibacterales bacterium]
MRTTLDLDDDILQAAKELAAARGSTAGKVLSELARRGLARDCESAAVRNGVPLLAPRPASEPRVTMKRVNELRDER